MRQAGAWLWQFQLYRWAMICGAQYLPKPFSGWCAFELSPLMFALRELALRDGDLDQAAKITAALQERGEL